MMTDRVTDSEIKKVKASFKSVNKLLPSHWLELTHHYNAYYLHKIKVDVEIVCCVWFATQESDGEVSIVPSYHKVFWVMDEESVLEGVTQFK